VEYNLNYIRRYRKNPLVDLGTLVKKKSYTQLNYGLEDIKKIIPHREPFLLIDRLTGLDLDEEEQIITGTRFISGEDPVFMGHFPGSPVYPGSLQLEMAGQIGLCLTYFVLNSRITIQENAQPVPVRATKILGALFLAPIYPDQNVVLISKKLDYDGYFGRVISQILNEETIYSVSISEVFFLDRG
jgi:3-hydroxyacyl-[acyl-carrier-protein] dehydratase